MRHGAEARPVCSSLRPIPAAAGRDRCALSPAAGGGDLHA